MSELVDIAKNLIAERYIPALHVLAAAVRGKSGKIYTGINLDCALRKAAICAEAVAIGAAIVAGEDEIVEVAAVRHPAIDNPDQAIHVVSPCGFCRELISDYGPNAIIHVPQGPVEDKTMLIRELLPNRYGKKRGPG